MLKDIQRVYARAQTYARQPLVIAIVLVCALVGSLFLVRYSAALSLAKRTNKAARLNVIAIQAKSASMDEHIVLPGSLLAWHEAAIYARANGYLKAWYVDIGYKVHKGDVLAVIERPELDAQLREAEDYYKEVSAQTKLALITAKRWSNLVKTDSVSKQANDDKNYQAQALQAELSKARANVEKLRAYVSFEKVIAPFTGIISLRQTDIGDLINIGSAPAQARPLFRLVQTDPLRLYVNIPQTYTSRIKPDMGVHLTFVEHPGQIFSAKLLKVAGAIDPKTLTLQAEFVVSNKQGILIPGSYAVVDFSIDSFPSSVILPVNTLVFRAAGLQVAVVEKNNRIALRNIKMGTDFGKYVQINSGIQPGERVVVNPLDAMYQGQRVRVATLNVPKTT